MMSGNFLNKMSNISMRIIAEWNPRLINFVRLLTGLNLSCSRLSGGSTKSEMLQRDKKYNKAGIIRKITTKLTKSASVDDPNSSFDYSMQVSHAVFMYLYNFGLQFYYTGDSKNSGTIFNVSIFEIDQD